MLHLRNISQLMGVALIVVSLQSSGRPTPDDYKGTVEMPDHEVYIKSMPKPKKADLSHLKPKVNKMKESIKKGDHAISKRAKDTLAVYQSEGFKNKVDGYVEHLKSEVFDEYTADEDASDESNNKDRPEVRVVLAVSSSMPKEVLKRYARDLEKVKGVMALRGFIGGNKHVKPTAKFVNEVLKKDPDCKGSDCELYRVGFSVDPIVFSKNNVKRVPALLVLKGDIPDSYCQAEEEVSTSKQPVYGAASLLGLLEAYEQETDDQRVNPLIKRLGG